MGFRKPTKRVPGKYGLRYYKNVGLGFSTPKEAIEGGARVTVAPASRWVPGPGACRSAPVFDGALRFLYLIRLPAYLLERSGTRAGPWTRPERFQGPGMPGRPIWLPVQPPGCTGDAAVCSGGPTCDLGGRRTATAIPRVPGPLLGFPGLLSGVWPLPE